MRSILGQDGRAASDEVELTVTGRRLRAHRRDLPDGWAAWYVDDVTEQHARMDSLLAERSRSRFLASASRRLGPVPAPRKDGADGGRAGRRRAGARGRGRVAVVDGR